MIKKINIISFSGGKDSTALILWAKENLEDFITVFCDTKWEHEETYKYVDYINKTILNGKLIVICSEKYNGFEELCIKKKRCPSTMARFCTEELKINPMKKFIKQYLPDVEIYTGVRADESFNRSQLTERAFADMYKCFMVRPLLKWTANDCFNISKKYNIKPNPLYKLGMKRVGCMPCIMVNKSELKNIINKFPDTILKLEKLEEEHKHSFFPPTYIPKRFCTGRTLEGKIYPLIGDVIKYVSSDKRQNNLFEQNEKCISYYSICE